MKKILVLSLLILALAATAYSQPKLDFRASGYMSMTTFLYRWNFSNQIVGRNGIYDVVPAAIKPGGVDWDKTVSYVEQRGRLKFDALMGKELSATFFFEADSRTFGDDSGTRNQIGYWTGDRAGLEIKNMYLDAAVPYVPVPITVRMGLQPFAVRPNMLMYIDGSGITAAAKVDPLTIIGMWAKAVEGEASTSDDVDFYGLHVNAKIDKLTVGGYGLNMAFRQYPMYSMSNSSAFDASPANGDMYWLGAYLDGRLGPVDVNFDAVYDWGKLKSKDWEAFAPDVKYKGWAARLKINFPWEMFNFGFVAAYGSGADTRKTGRNGQPGTSVGDAIYADAGALSSKVDGYVVVPGSETGSFNESEIIFGSYVGDGFSGVAYTSEGTRVTKGSIGGLWLAKLYGSYKVTPDYKVTLQGLYIGDTTKNGSTLGTAMSSTGRFKNGKTVGWELDLINEWQVYKNLTFRFGGGILWAGDALKFWHDYGDGVGKNEKPDMPWMFATKLIYNF